MARYVPKHQAQLGRGVPVPGRTRGSRDCGPRSWQMGVDARTRGKHVPGVRALRSRARKVGPVPTSVWDAKRALDGLSWPRRKPIRYRIKRNIRAVRSAVAAGKPVHLCIDYGVLNRELSRTGDPGFSGGHSVLVYGQKRTRSGVRWLLFDPLDDGRRKGIPQGPRWVPRSALVAAAVAFGGGAGRVYAGVIAGGARR